MAEKNNEQIAKEFTPEEIENLKSLLREKEHIDKIVENDRRLRWFYASLRIWAGWTLAVVVGLYTIYDIILKLLKGSH